MTKWFRNVLLILHLMKVHSTRQLITVHVSHLTACATVSHRCNGEVRDQPGWWYLWASSKDIIRAQTTNLKTRVILLQNKVYVQCRFGLVFWPNQYSNKIFKNTIILRKFKLKFLKSNIFSFSFSTIESSKIKGILLIDINEASTYSKINTKEK